MPRLPGKRPASPANLASQSGQPAQSKRVRPEAQLSTVIAATQSGQTLPLQPEPTQQSGQTTLSVQPGPSGISSTPRASTVGHSTITTGITTTMTNAPSTSSTEVFNFGLSASTMLTDSILPSTAAVLGPTNDGILVSGAVSAASQLQDAELYRILKRYILTEAQLVTNGFPRVNPFGVPSVPKIKEKPSASSKKPKHINGRLCTRCDEEFIVCSNGSYPPSQCRYHWRSKVSSWTSPVYRCCDGGLESPTCSVAPYHVHEQNKLDAPCGFVATKACSPKLDENYGVFALDCEMVYTLSGKELARVTVINSKCQPVYETLVKPKLKIVDYNTRFSGITEKDMQDVSTTIQDVQARLLATFSAQTILIGHSLEYDLIALKLIHSTVVDTSVVFPHHRGPPCKMALKTLALQYLQKIIQQDVGGHDSQEDAAACMELMRKKVKEDI